MCNAESPTTADPDLERIEEEFVLWLAKQYSAGRHAEIPIDSICREIGICRGTLDAVMGTLRGQKLWFTAPGQSLRAAPEAEVRAREIRRRRAAETRERELRPDVVAVARHWSRRNKVIAGFIIGFVVVTALATLANQLVSLIVNLRKL